MNYRNFALVAVTAIAFSGSVGKAEAQGIGMNGGVGLIDRGIGFGFELGYVPSHRFNIQGQFHQPTYPRHYPHRFSQSPQFFQQPQYHYPGHFIQPQFVPQTPQFFQQPQQPIYIKHSNRTRQEVQAEPLELSVKKFERGFYRTIIETGNRCYNLGGLENVFEIQPATEGGYIEPNFTQVTSWRVNRTGTYQILAKGNDWSLQLGIATLYEGYVIRLVKIAPRREDIPAVEPIQPQQQR